MERQVGKSIAVFSQPFRLSGFDELLPAGEYDIETELVSPPDHRDPEGWKASVLVHLQPRMSHPGLARSLTVSLAELDNARAKDKLSGKTLSQFFLEEMLADPMVRLVMQADGVSERQLRHLYGCSRTQGLEREEQSQEPATHVLQDRPTDTSAIRAAENEGMPTRSDYPCSRQPARRRSDDGQGSKAMTDDPVDLDERRSPESRIAADIRRHSLKDFEADQDALRRRQAELEAQLLAESATNWHEAAVKAQYLIRRYAETSEAQDARRQELIQRALGDIARLLEAEATNQ